MTAGAQLAQQAAFAQLAAFTRRTSCPGLSKDQRSPTEIESSPALVLPQLLSDAEIAQCFEAASACSDTRSGQSTRLAGFRLRAEADLRERAVAATLEATLEQARMGYDVAYSNAHTALFLHRDGFFARDHGRLLSKLVQTMRAQPGNWGDPKTALSVRCVELHTYVQSGALMDQGHRDKGSVLTMAVLLSDSAATEGGKFMTWKADGVTPLLHDMERGDAILFCVQLRKVPQRDRGHAGRAPFARRRALGRRAEHVRSV